MKDDQRIALTKRLLREGLLRLLSKTDLNKISVTQLCIESGINRATFYRHYEEPRDILNDIKYLLEVKMTITEPKIYMSKTEDFTNIAPIIEEEIVGFIKFSDYI